MIDRKGAYNFAFMLRDSSARLRDFHHEGKFVSNERLKFTFVLHADVFLWSQKGNVMRHREVSISISLYTLIISYFSGSSMENNVPGETAVNHGP